MPSFPSPEPKVSCFDDLDFFKDLENEFPVIVYNDALMSKSDHLTEPTLSPQHIDESDLKDETSLSEYDEVEQNILYFNDLFHFNIIYPDNLKSDKDNDNNEIDIIHSWGFIVELKVNTVTWNYLVNGMLLNLIKNLNVLFGIHSTLNGIIRLAITQECCGGQGMALSPRDQRHQLLRFEGLQYTDADIADFEERLRRIYNRESAGDFLGTTPSYTSIRDPMLRLCHRLIACSIAGRINIPYLLAMYLRLSASGRKREALIFEGQFIARLAEHFGLLTEERL
ncbi:hypothetical protein Tco_0402073 [Tanacetum coccineum]